jgi:DNA-binding winged helix-turn-helix (wHTH) protein
MRVRFANFTLDTDSRQLMRDDSAVHLSPKAFDVLCHLVERRPGALSKQELFELIWPDTAVVEANLTVLIAEVRRALGDEAQRPRFIRTLHTHGYAFCADATDITRTPNQPSRLGLVWEGRVLYLAEGENVIGRDPSSGVWLDVAGVSRRHARIVARGADAMIEDLGSTNGTFVGDVAVAAARPLADGDLIQLGSAQVRFRIWSSAVETERIVRRQ